MHASNYYKFLYGASLGGCVIYFIQSLSLHSLYYAEACNELAVPTLS